MSKVHFLAALLCIFMGAASAQELKVNMRVLILTPKNSGKEFPSLLAAQRILRGFGIPFDVKAMADNRGPLDLVSTDGAGKYYGVVMTDQRLSYQGKSSMSEGQWNELKEYVKHFKVRQVSLYSNPANIGGLQLIEAANEKTNTVILDQNFAKYDPAAVAGAQAKIEWNTHFPAAIKPGLQIWPVAHFGNYVNGHPGRAVAGVHLRTSDGREMLHLFYNPILHSLATYSVAPAWVNWMTRGVFVGKRRAYLTAQVDDHFLASDMDTANVSGSMKVYRLGAHDMAHFAINSNRDLRALAKNPELRIDIAFNGAGTMERGGFTGDELYKTSRKYINEFNWVSHTYTHKDLNRISYSDAMYQLSENAKFAKTLMAGFEHRFSPHSMVTPHISGLFNGDALRAMKSNGIYHIVNDTSVSKQLGPHPHTAYWSSSRVNGEDGVLIMPRYPTDIYFETSLPGELTEKYHDMRSGPFGIGGKHYSLDDVMREESERVLYNILNYQAAAYMFHQANMRTFEYGNGRESLLSLWMKKMINDFRRFSTLPILAQKMDDMAQHYKDMMALESCGRNGRLFIEQGQITRVQVWGNGRCTIPLSVVGSEFEGATAQSYGPDRTIETRLTGSGRVESKSFVLTSPIKY